MHEQIIRNKDSKNTWLIMSGFTVMSEYLHYARPNGQMTEWTKQGTNERMEASGEGVNAHAIAKYQCIKLCVDCGLIYRMSKIMRESEQQSKANHTALHQTEMNSVQQIHQLLISIGGCFVSKVICVNLQKRWNGRAHVDKKRFDIEHRAPNTVWECLENVSILLKSVFPIFRIEYPNKRTPTSATMNMRDRVF